MSERIAIIGARGHTGSELMRLFAAHPGAHVSHVGSRALAGQEAMAGVRYTAIEPEDAAALDVAAVVLALPNDASAPYVAAIPEATCIVDLSSDHRFDDGWRYGLPERHRDALRGARRIANPGCYATAAQLAIDPLLGELTAPPRIFGVSGYSGAGTTPSPRNDPDKLRDNLMPYALVGHTHEQEIGRHLGQRVHFMPHVAPFFRGITLTIDMVLRDPTTTDALLSRYVARYRDEPLVRVQEAAPLVRDAAHSHHVTIGGFSCDGTRAVVVATIDNLLKGAATQALQNVNLALGLDERAGLPA